MVSIPETRELLSLLILIAGLSGVFMFVEKPFDIAPVLLTSPFHTPLVLGAFTRVPLVANPVVHILVPKHNIFELQ